MRVFHVRGFKAWLAALVLAGLLAMTLASSAYASDGGKDKGKTPVEPPKSVRSGASVSCSGTGCNGLDPQVTGCNNGAYTATSLTIANFGGSGHTALLETRWSPTCQTNWARITFSSTSDIPPNLGGLPTAYLDLIGSGGATVGSEGIINSYLVQYGMMYYAPIERVKACFEVTTSSPPYFQCTPLA